MIIYENKKFVQPLIDEIAETWHDTCKTPLKQLDFQKMMTYFTTGNRLGYETEYFSRRKALLVAGLYAIGNETSQAIEVVEDVMYQVLQEYTWALPAHLDYHDLSSQALGTSIDLFAAETAQALAEISYQLKDKLSQVLLSLVDEEIERRILRPFELKSWHWEYKENNWSSVIAGCIGMTILRKVTEISRRTRLLSKLETSFQSFLRGFGEDGACIEGVGYWSYGFGYYLYYAEMLAGVTGDLTYFNLPKIKEIAKFPYYTEIATHHFLPFGDYDQTLLPSGLLAIIQKRLGVSLPSVGCVSLLDNDCCYRFAPMYVNLIYSQPMTQLQAPQMIHYFHNSQWLVVKDIKKGLFFAARGGRNDESHNHNDLGHFVYGGLGKLSLTDLGAGEYTKAYFEDEHRYNYLVNSSLSHSVPIINGRKQEAGEYRAEVLICEQTEGEVIFCLELKDAYPKNPELLSFKRWFKLSLVDYELQIKDNFSFSSNHNRIIENFVTQSHIIVGDQQLLLINDDAQVKLTMPVAPKIYHESYRNHFGEEAPVKLIQNQYIAKRELEIVYKIIKE